MSRRVLIAALAAGAGFALTIAPLGGTAGLQRMARASDAVGFDPAAQIKHVVIILKENQTFNAILGPWCARQPARGCRGDDIGTLEPTSTGKTVPLMQGTDIVPQVNHSNGAQLTAWNGGLDNGWDKITGGTGTCGSNGSPPYKCYRAYAPSQVPNVTRFAAAFAISDQTRTCQMAASWNDKLTWTSACDQDGFKGEIPKPEPGTPAKPGWGCTSDKVTPWSADGTTFINEPSCIPDYSTGLPYGGAFRQTPVQPQRSLLENCDSTAGCTWTDYNTARIWSPAAMRAYSVYKHPSYSTPAIFLTDAKTGHLPSLSFVTESLPGGSDSFHNGDSITVGDNSVGKEVSAVMQGPLWMSTAIFLTWDDCGCFYDPVAPNRMPMLLISPWVRAAYTDHTPTSFAGVQRFVELTFGLSPLNSTDANAYPYADSFDFTQTPLAPVEATISRIPETSARNVEHPSRLADDDS